MQDNLDNPLPRARQQQQGKGPIPSLHEVLQCQISSWYDRFSNLSTPNKLKRRKATIQTVILDLPSDFVEYLRQNDSAGLRLPRGAKTSSILHVDVKAANNNNNNDDDSSSTDWSTSDNHNDGDVDNDEPDDDDSNNFFAKDVSFPALDEQIGKAIADLGGAVVPKLNWSCPKDAVWMNGGSLRCQTPGDVYLLLKSSDFCSYDLEQSLIDVIGNGSSTNIHMSQQGEVKTNNQNDDDDDDERLNQDPKPPSSSATTTTTTVPLPVSASCSSSVSSSSTSSCKSNRFRFQLALRKWCNLYPSHEFRCFVRRHELIAISQRHDSQHFPHLVHDHAVQTKIKSLLLDFFEHIVRDTFSATATTATTTTTASAEEEEVPNYVFDAYIDQQDKVWLIDFNVWAARTDALLFDWEELLAMDCTTRRDHAVDDVELRVVETAKEVRGDPLATYRAPIDTVHLASWMTSSCGDTNSNGAGNNAMSNAFEEFTKLCERPSRLDEAELEETED